MRFTVRIGHYAAMVLAAIVNSFAVLTASVLLLAACASAQTFNASLGGTVTDSTGAVLTNAVVTATGIETGVAIKTTTNTSGVYEFPSLQEGNYRVSAGMTGFKEFVYQRVVLDVGAQVRLNFTLTVGAANTTVEVAGTAESPLLTTSAVVGGII